MKNLLRNVYFTSFLAAFVIVTSLTVLADTKLGEPAGVLLAPGMLLGALIFPEGAHSDFGTAYIVLAVLIDVVLVALLLVVVRKLMRRRRTQAPR